MDVTRGKRARDRLVKAHQDEAENCEPSNNASHTKVQIELEYLPHADTSALYERNPRIICDQITASANRGLIGPNSTWDERPDRNCGAVQELGRTLSMSHDPQANQEILVQPRVERPEMFLIGQVQELKLRDQLGDLTGRCVMPAS